MASDRAHTRGESSPLSTPVEELKRAAARAAAELVEDGMRLGLGTGSTVAHLLPALAERKLSGVRCAATSPATEHAALSLGLTVLDPDQLPELDRRSTAPIRSIPPDGSSRAAAGPTRARRSLPPPRARSS